MRTRTPSIIRLYSLLSQLRSGEQGGMKLKRLRKGYGSSIFSTGILNNILPCSLALCFLILLGSEAATADQQQAPNGDAKTPVTVADCIRMTRFADGLYEVGDRAGDRVAEWSPDGSRFVVVLRHGNLEQNTNEYSLVSFNAVDVSNSAVHPETLVTMLSSSNRPGLSHVKWVDNNTITFIGERPGEVQQVYAFNSTTKKLTKLVSWPRNIVAYDVSADFHQVIFLAEPPKNDLITDEARRKGIVVS